MRVLYDGVIYRIQQYGGVVRYFNGLIRHLPPSIDPILLAANPPAVAPQNPKLATHIESCEKFLWPIKPLRKEIIARRSFKRVNSEKPDIIHPTYYYSSLRHFNDRIDIPTVLTVYDLIHEKFPKQMDPYGKQVRLKFEAIKRADAIVCISESTRNDLLNHYYVPEEKTRVIYPGCDFSTPPNVIATDETRETRQGSAVELDYGRQYLLYVGERGFYKNFERALRAFADVALTSPELELRCVGGRPFSREEYQLMADLGVSRNVVWIGHLPDLEMPRIYAEACALIYPSLYEGFGIPILEAMSCGTAVLTSNRASMPEVAANAAMLFDPYSIDDIAAAIQRVTRDQTARSELIRRGMIRANEFSLPKAAQQMADVYHSVARCSEVAA